MFESQERERDGPTIEVEEKEEVPQMILCTIVLWLRGNLRWKCKVTKWKWTKKNRGTKKKAIVHEWCIEIETKWVLAHLSEPRESETGQNIENHN